MAVKNAKITYIGDIRIVGLVTREKKTIGYMLFVEKSGKIQIVSETILRNIYNRYKFSNIEIIDGKIICTECALDRFPRYIYDGNQIVGCLDRDKMYIIGEICKNNEVIGYRVIAANGKVVDLQKHDIIESQSKDIDIVNAHIRDGVIVPNKEKKFMQIEYTDDPKEENGISHWTHNNYGHKTSDDMKKRYIQRLLNFSLSGKYNLPLPTGSYRYGYSDSKNNSYINEPNTNLAINKMISIIKNEVFIYAHEDEKITIAKYMQFIKENAKSADTKAYTECVLKLKVIGSLILRSGIKPKPFKPMLLSKLQNLMVNNNINELYITPELYDLYTKTYNEGYKQLIRNKALEIHKNKIIIVEFTKHTHEYVNNIIKNMENITEDHLEIQLSNDTEHDINLYFHDKFGLALNQIEKAINKTIPLVVLNKTDQKCKLYSKHNIVVPDTATIKLSENCLDTSENNRRYNTNCIVSSDMTVGGLYEVSSHTGSVISKADNTYICCDYKANEKYVASYCGKYIWRYWLIAYINTYINVSSADVSGVLLSTIDTDAYTNNINEKIRIITTLMSIFDADGIDYVTNYINKLKILDSNKVVQSRFELMHASILEDNTINSIIQYEELGMLEFFYNNPLHIKINSLKKAVFIGGSLNENYLSCIQKHNMYNVDIGMLKMPDIYTDYTLINNEYNNNIVDIVSQLIIISGMDERRVILGLINLPLYNIERK